MKLVIDTNVLISGLLWSGTPRTAIDFCANKLAKNYVSPAILRELLVTLQKDKFSNRMRLTGATPHQSTEFILSISTVVNPNYLPDVDISDVDDLHVLACALAAEADCIISGDKHLLSLESFRNIPIMRPADFCKKYL